ncbi:Uncharacterized membrane protein YkvA, DUF1232 family [Catalinimonas alkaloidigena]|uniref:Uncharacterized membrane protein YkvA, DUF1232 family n=1 Tax=Catalinimonas alkaloidigena TaxID=1075417 RepID=A0A1G9JC22_9BACT|nr:Uncharacterized membrane protein YkvA, DUF1232 family [Catalinimonas alkaloidigena]
MNSHFFRKAQRQAKKLINDPEKLDNFIDYMDVKIKELRKEETVKEIINYVKTFGRLVGAYRSGRYREISQTKIILVLGALVYFVSPMDLVPDFIPVFGLLDDLGVLVWVFNTVKHEIEKFQAWEGVYADFEEITDTPKNMPTKVRAK